MSRIRAACDARNGKCVVDTLVKERLLFHYYVRFNNNIDTDENPEEGADILIMARTDARCISMNEAIIRCQEFRKAGADITFLVSTQAAPDTAAVVATAAAVGA